MSCDDVGDYSGGKESTGEGKSAVVCLRERSVYIAQFEIVGKCSDAY